MCLACWLWLIWWGFIASLRAGVLCSALPLSGAGVFACLLVPLTLLLGSKMSELGCTHHADSVYFIVCFRVCAAAARQLYLGGFCVVANCAGRPR